MDRSTKARGDEQHRQPGQRPTRPALGGSVAPHLVEPTVDRPLGKLRVIGGGGDPSGGSGVDRLQFPADALSESSAQSPGILVGRIHRRMQAELRSKGPQVRAGHGEKGTDQPDSIAERPRPVDAAPSTWTSPPRDRRDHRLELIVGVVCRHDARRTHHSSNVPERILPAATGEGGAVAGSGAIHVANDALESCGPGMRFHQRGLFVGLRSKPVIHVGHHKSNRSITLRDRTAEPQHGQGVPATTDGENRRFSTRNLPRIDGDGTLENRGKRRAAGVEQTRANIAGFLLAAADNHWINLRGSTILRVRQGRRVKENVVDGSESWWGEHWSEVVAVVLAGGFLALVGTAVRSSLMLGQAAVNRRIRNRRASDAAAAGGSEWRAAIHRLEQRITALEAVMEHSPDDPIESSVLARLSAATTDVRDEVERLSQAGRSVDEIARELGEPIGRIELILNLRRASGQS